MVHEMPAAYLIAEWAALSPVRLNTQADRVMGEDELWYILACMECFCLFDVAKDKAGDRLPSRCHNCR